MTSPGCSPAARPATATRSRAAPMDATRTPLPDSHTVPIVAPPPPITPGPTIIPGPGEPQPELEPSILASLLSGGLRLWPTAKATDPTNRPTAATSPTPNHQ